MNFSREVRNARCDAIAAAIGPSPILRIRTGPPPADCLAADQGVSLARLVLPVNWMAPASNGSVERLGLWQIIAADETGTPGHFRIYDSAGVSCEMQGTIGVDPMGGFDMVVSAATITAGKTITVVSFTITDGNA